MSKIVIIGAGAMGTAFALPCLDNNHDTNIVGTHLENDFIEKFKNNGNLHPGLNTKIPNEIKIFKFEKFLMSSDYLVIFLRDSAEKCYIFPMFFKFMPVSIDDVENSRKGVR